MRIFVTGIAGFLGSHLADKFIADGHTVIGIDNMTGGYLDNVPKRAYFWHADCCDLEMITELMKDVDIVYHCAALAYEGLSVFSPKIVVESIVLATTSVISSAIQNKVRRFIYCSSMARYGTNKVPFTEDMKPNPQDPYGIGKYASELLLKNLSEVHGMEWVIAVPHNIIGPRQKYDDPYRNVAAIFINAMLQGKQPIIYGDGEQKRCFSPIDEDVEPLYRMAFDNIAGEVINIGPDDEFITINELAERIAKIIGFELNPIRHAGRPQEVIDANCSGEKARKLFDYHPQHKLDDVLIEMVEYVKARGIKPFDYHLPLEIMNHKTPKSWGERLY